MGIGWQLPTVCNQKGPRHPEVNEQNEIRIEPDNHLLATSIDGPDTLAFELGLDESRIDRTREPLVEDLDRFERPAGEDRRQLSSDGLDLGEFGHAR